MVCRPRQEARRRPIWLRVAAKAATANCYPSRSHHRRRSAELGAPRWIRAIAAISGDRPPTSATRPLASRRSFVPQIDIAVPFSIRGIMRLLGLPEADDDPILKLSWGLVGPGDPVRRLADPPTTAICRAGLGFQDYFDPVAADRRACPRHDLSSVIATAEVQGEPMPDYERFSYNRYAGGNWRAGNAAQWS